VQRGHHAGAELDALVAHSRSPSRNEPASQIQAARRSSARGAR
jgi:hypothetical protein